MLKEQKLTYKIKISLTGTYNVGKTSLMYRQIKDVYGQENRTTIGCDFMTKTYNFADIQLKAYIWDPSGGQRFKSITQRFYKNSHAILVCFDLTDQMSFQYCRNLLTQLKSYVDQNCNFYLIGCKSDLQPQVKLEHILDFCQIFNIKYFQTSARQNYGVHEAFKIIVNEVFSKNQLNIEKQKIMLKNKVLQKTFFSCF